MSFNISVTADSTYPPRVGEYAIKYDGVSYETGQSFSVGDGYVEVTVYSEGASSGEYADMPAYVYLNSVQVHNGGKGFSTYKYYPNNDATIKLTRVSGDQSGDATRAFITESQVWKEPQSGGGNQSCMVNGTALKLKPGKTLVSGTAFQIKKGKTLVNGSAYEIGLSGGGFKFTVNPISKIVLLQITVKDSNGATKHEYAMGAAQTVTAPLWGDILPTDTITLQYKATSGDSDTSAISLNGQQKVSGSNKGLSSGVSYTLENLTGDIQLSGAVSGSTYTLAVTMGG